MPTAAQNLQQLSIFAATYDTHVDVCRKCYNQAEQDRYDRGVQLWSKLHNIRKEGQVILATFDRRYEVSISMQSEHWLCSCPDGKQKPCKHIVALATYWERCRVLPAKEKLEGAVQVAMRTVMEG